MADAREFPFRGSVIWLTPEQGGRTTGPPEPGTAWPYYAATAYVPPHTADSGLTSFILRNFETGAWRSHAEGRWLVDDPHGSQLVRPGSVIAVTEGVKVVAYFTIRHIQNLKG
jgi:hypothetical protein